MNIFEEQIQDLGKLIDAEHKALRRYGKMSKYEKIMLYRTLNSAFHILSALKPTTFEDLEIATYMKVSSEEQNQLIKLFVYQLEETQINKDNFVLNLHGFYMSTGLKILKNPRPFFDFIDFVSRRQRMETNYQNIYDAYISLLLQQCAYLGYLKGYEEKICCGLTTDNEILFKDDIFPYSDVASYELEEAMYQCLKRHTSMDTKMFFATYKKYGYTLNKSQDAEILNNKCRIFSNNHYMMLSYINEHTVGLLPDKEYGFHHVSFPREWASTDILLEKLQKRKYCLPSRGVVAKYYNAEEIKEIHFMEIYKNAKVILLYKVINVFGHEFSGYFDTNTKDFYSIFERTNFEQFHEVLKNFILENYYTLTCEPTIDRKKMSVLLQVDDITKKDFDNYPRQPVVCYMYHHKESKRSVQTPNTTLRHYNRDNYKSERTSVNGYIRKLPTGQCASAAAKQLAISLGYDLSADETYVRPFEKTVLKIKEVE